MNFKIDYFNVSYMKHFILKNFAVLVFDASQSKTP